MKKGTITKIASIMVAAFIVSLVLVLIPRDDCIGVQRTVHADSFDLQTAINEAESVATIVLTGSVNDGVIIPEDKDITIDLNGFSIITTDEFAIVNNGSLTIQGSGLVKGQRRALTNNGKADLLSGVFTNISESGYVIYNDATGNITIENATITANQDNTGRYAMYNLGTMVINPGTEVVTFGTSTMLHSGSNIVNEAGGSLTINGGKFTAPYSNICCISEETGEYSGCEITINDGEFIATKSKARNIYFCYQGSKPQTGSLLINGGSFVSQNNNFLSYNKNYWISTVISGGSFSSESSFANNTHGITVDSATVSSGDAALLNECSSISLINVISEKEINSSCVKNGAIVNGGIIGIEDPSGDAKWYVGPVALEKLKDAVTYSKVTVIYGVVSTNISHDIDITVSSSASAYINNKVVPADGQMHTIHIDLQLANTHPCLSPESTTAYYCSDCGKYYEDPEGATEIDDVDSIVYVYSHTIQQAPALEPQVGKDGYEKHYKCTRCGELFSDSEGNNRIDSPTIIPALKPTTAPKVSLKINRNTASVVCGSSITLSATVKGTNDKVRWKSSDSKVASVDSTGKITSKKAGTVTITASVSGVSATCPVTVLYKDVANNEDFWYAPTNYLTAAGIVKGYDNQTLFKPTNECSRAQMVTFLWRLAGQPNPNKTTTDFKDIKTTDYFYKPVLWAVEKGITTGVSKTSFNPQGICTRAQTVTFLWRMAGKPVPKSKTCKFTDVKSKDYFYNATIWASDMKIVAGYEDNTFKPQGHCLRRQMVTFLYKYDKYVNGKG